MIGVRYGLLALAIGLLLVAACTSAKPTATPTPTPAPISPYEELLGLIPDTPETRSSVFISDYALVRTLFDFPLPGPGASQRAMERYYNYDPPLEWWKESLPDFRGVGTPGFLSDGYGPWGFALYELYKASHRQYLGFDIRNEEQAMVAGSSPRQLEVLRGHFDPAAFDRALSACSGECTPPDTREKYQGVTFSSWGEDFAANPQKRLAPPAFDDLGRGGRIAVQDKYVLRTLGTDDMRSTIDASLDKRPSLADWEDYRLLAQGMSELGAYGMFLTDQTQGFEALCQSPFVSEGECTEVRSELENQPMLRPYQVFATGVGKDSLGAYTALVLVHADEAAASDNVALLRWRIEQAESLAAGRPWTDFFDTYGMEIVARGRVLQAKLRPAEGSWPAWIEWVLQRDPLLLHEGEAGSAATSTQVSPMPTATAVPTPTPLVPVATVPLPTATPPTSEGQVIQVNLAAKDIIYDPFTQLIWASVRGEAGSKSNTITSIDPRTGTIGPFAVVGSEPGKLAISDDGRYLYVSLDGAAQVRRFDISSRSANIQDWPSSEFSLGRGDSGAYYVEDIEVLPGKPEAVAVSLKYPGVSPSFAGVAIYDNGIQRPVRVPGFGVGGDIHVDVIEFSSTGSRLYGGSNSSSPTRFYRLNVDANGVSILDDTRDLLPGGFSSGDIKFDGGLIYTGWGAVIDPEDRVLVGKYDASGLVEPDSARGLVFFLQGNRLLAFDRGNFLLLGLLEVPGFLGQASSLIRWGENGLAFLTDSGQVFLIRFPVKATSKPLPTPTPLAAAPEILLDLYQGQDLFGGAQQVTLAGMLEQGKPLVLAFYAGLCPPCRVQMPELQEFFVNNKERILLVAVDVGPSTGLGSYDDGRALVNELKVTYPAGATLDRDTVQKYGVAGVPSTYFITPDGKLFRAWTGPLNRSVLERISTEMLAASATPTPTPTAALIAAPTRAAATRSSAGIAWLEALYPFPSFRSAHHSFRRWATLLSYPWSLGW